MVVVKSEEEIEKMKMACLIVKDVLEEVAQYVRAGNKTKVIDKFVETYIYSHSAKPSFKNYNGFPSSCCVSVNDVVVHGIPGDYVLKSGDVVSVDVGAFMNGFHGDAARTFIVDGADDEVKKLVKVTERSFYEGLKGAVVGGRLTDISHKIQMYVEKNNFSVIRDFYGHGIGRELHEGPAIPNYGVGGRGVLLKHGMTLAIEPMVAMGKYFVRTLDDGWTTVTSDGSLSAHYENTIAITNDGPVILTV